MAVNLIPKSKDASEINVSNRTWFTLVNTSALKDVLGEQHSNDTHIVSARRMSKFADHVRAWPIPDGWGEPYGGEKLKANFIEFFEFCGGFYTC